MRLFSYGFERKKTETIGFFLAYEVFDTYRKARKKIFSVNPSALLILTVLNKFSVNETLYLYSEMLANVIAVKFLIMTLVYVKIFHDMS